jgi:hypothetical protein
MKESRVFASKCFFILSFEQESCVTDTLFLHVDNIQVAMQRVREPYICI